MRARDVVGALALAGVVVAGAIAAPPLWLLVDEGAVPPASEAPALPKGVDARYRGVSCGSGGCWREWTLGVPPGTSPAAIVERMGLAEERCEPRWLLDRRQVCTGARVVGADVRLSLQYARSL